MLSWKTERIQIKIDALLFDEALFFAPDLFQIKSKKQGIDTYIIYIKCGIQEQNLLISILSHNISMKVTDVYD